MKLGKVKYEIYYVVDLENREMVDIAKEAVENDLMQAFKDWNFVQSIEEEEDNNLTESDISSWIYEILDTSSEEKENQNGDIQS